MTVIDMTKLSSAFLEITFDELKRLSVAVSWTDCIVIYCNIIIVTWALIM